MQSKIIFVIFSILLLSVTSCYAGQEPDSSQNNKETGDIQVSAVAYGLLPYMPESTLNQRRFKLTLCKMPRMEPVDIPDWIGERPTDAESFNIWRNEIRDSLKDSARIILDYIYDSLGILSSIGGAKELSIENQYAVGITDSMGNYVFSDIPIGRYQLICEYPDPDTSIVSVWDTLSEHQADSLRQWLKEIRNDSSKARPVDIGNSMTEKGTHGQSRWIPIVMNYIRVAKDSISLVQTGVSWISPREVGWFDVVMWPPKFKERGKRNERKNE